ncbi:MAG: hypothetical protein JRJ78_08445 [Deltaproteobacteria bacterium]|nr:hypothetical protein [Deltaproteobacteria bacterium]
MMKKEYPVRREGDLVLIHYQEKPAVYARIESIASDVKKDWYQVTLLLLTIPSRTITWILREEYINGVPFTMGGQPVRLGEVKSPFTDKKTQKESPSTRKKPGEGPARVIPFKRES